MFVSRLRKAVEAGAIQTRAPGYVAVGEVDAARFRALVGEAAALRERGEATLLLLQEALALWRGPALAEFAFEPWAAEHIARLEEERLLALEERLELELELGRDAHLVPELEALCASQPLRDARTPARPHAQLMLSLYRAGRQADALDVYAQLKQRLLEEVGPDPSPDLQALERQLLQQDAALTPAERRRRPEGTVTLLFTDVEGSTELLHELGGEAYSTVLEIWPERPSGA